MTMTVTVVKAGDWRTIKQREERKRNWKKVVGAGSTAAGVGTSVVGLGHQLEGPTFDRRTLNAAKDAGKRFPYVRAAAKTPKGKLRLAGMGIGLAGVGAMGAGGIGALHEQRQINRRRKANAARATERARQHDKLRRHGINRGGHIFMERTGPDGEIMQTHSGFKYGPDEKIVRVGKARGPKVPLTPEQRDQRALDRTKSKSNQAKFGLANNAFGAAAGVVGTKAVYDQQKQAMKLKKIAAAGGEMPRQVAPKIGRFERGMAKLKIKPKYALPAAAAAAVGSQLVNAGMDAQSGAYFAGETGRLARKQRKIKQRIAEREAPAVAKSYEQLFDVVILNKSDGPGRNLLLDEEVSKRKRRFDPEGDRQRRLGMYQGAGLAGAAGLTGAAGATGFGAWKAGNATERAALKALGKRAILPGALLAGAAGAGGVARAANRQANSARNQRWT